MIKVLHNYTAAPPMAQAQNSIQSQAEKAVQKTLTEKPGGLLGIESELKKYAQVPDSLKTFKSQHHHYFVVGIGGSSLGVQVLTDVFQIRNFEFIDNVDATHFENILKRTKNLAETGWIVISKSGSTIETLAALDFINQFYQDHATELKSHCIVVTEKKQSDLYNWSQQNETLYFEVPVSVGGRFSVLTSVGLIPAMLMGLDVQKFQTGALKAYENSDALTAVTQATLQSFARNEWISVLWSYSSRLRSFGFWWQQLWAESLAKKTDRNQKPAPRVSTPWPLVGATDQHSTLQQVMEGARDKMVFFLRAQDAEMGQLKLKKSNLKETSLLQGYTLGSLLKAEAEAIQQALTHEGVSNMSIMVSKLDEETLGEMFMFFQLLIIALAEALNINAFDQPGVELGKVKAKMILKEASIPRGSN